MVLPVIFLHENLALIMLTSILKKQVLIAYKAEILHLFNGLEDFIAFHNENEILEGME